MGSPESLINRSFADYCTKKLVQSVPSSDTFIRSSSSKVTDLPQSVPVPTPLNPFIYQGFLVFLYSKSFVTFKSFEIVWVISVFVIFIKITVFEVYPQVYP